MKIGREKGGTLAGHGTDRTDFTSFDVSCAAPYNVGLHFGTRAAELDRLAYLGRARTPSAPCAPSASGRLLKCRLDIRNPFRVDDVFGFSYIGILTALEDEIVSRESAGRARTPAAPSLRAQVTRLIDDYMLADDDPVLSRRGKAYLAYCRRLNADIIRLFQSLGYDGLVYANEIEGGKSAADSYVVFDASQVTILGEESDPIKIPTRVAA